ncbi:MAG: PHP domain-containing protein [Anaerolineae bacterium]|nr:PHP domain-containing protein [Anaerolineae bacterium]
MLDLHTHTTASDGQLTPAQLVELAREIGLDTIAITDHDTTSGIIQAQEAAPSGFEVIAGIELSAEDAGGDVHMLGYCIDLDNAIFQTALEEFRSRRYFRAQKIAEKLAALELPVEWDRIEAIAEGGAIGRPHIARAMMEAGYVTSVKEAFERFLENGGPAYVARKRLSPEESVELIHIAGGAAVLAHPVYVKDHRAMIDRLLPVGLDGIEVVYPDHPPALQAELRAIAQAHDLIMTGGSDFHGLNLPGKAMLGSVTPPADAVQALKARAADYSQHRA